MKALKSKFKIGDTVAMQYDEFHFSPTHKVISVGKVESIHFYNGTEMFIRTGKGETKARSLKGKIIYNVSGFSLMPDEKDLIEWEEDK